MSREELILCIYKKGRLSAFLKYFSYAIVLYGVALYGLLLYKAYAISPLTFLLTALVSAVAFFAVTLARRLIDAKRPYELFDIFEMPPKNKKGRSFPSRHVFSLFCVGTLAIPVLPIMSAAALALGVVLSVIRVLLGIHFVRDTVCGCIVGIVSGIIGIFAAGLPLT